MNSLTTVSGVETSNLTVVGTTHHQRLCGEYVKLLHLPIDLNLACTRFNFFFKKKETKLRTPWSLLITD